MNKYHYSFQTKGNKVFTQFYYSSEMFSLRLNFLLLLLCNFNVLNFLFILFKKIKRWLKIAYKNFVCHQQNTNDKLYPMTMMIDNEISPFFVVFWSEFNWFFIFSNNSSYNKFFFSEKNRFAFAQVIGWT